MLRRLLGKPREDAETVEQVKRREGCEIDRQNPSHNGRRKVRDAAPEEQRDREERPFVNREGRQKGGGRDARIEPNTGDIERMGRPDGQDDRRYMVHERTNARAVALTSAALDKADTMAAIVAPVSRARTRPAASMPPIAATGRGVAATTALTPATPIGGPASAFDAVAKSGPAPR